MTEKEINDRKRTLESSYYMHKRTYDETKQKRETMTDRDGNLVYRDSDKNEETLQLLDNARMEIVTEYESLGGTEEELLEKCTEFAKDEAMRRVRLMQAVQMSEDKIKAREDMMVQLEEIKKKKAEKEAEYKALTEGVNEIGATVKPISAMEEYTVNQSIRDMNPFTVPVEPIRGLVNEIPEPTHTQDIEKKVAGGFSTYEMVSLPSKGEAYRSKVASVPVGYLTANDENLIVAPNLYKKGTFLDYMIASKLMSDTIKVDDLLLGDRDAIILWLRGSSYGNIFPVTATDDATGDKFNYDVDLEKLQYKPFNLKGDENGYFDYELPVSKDKVKFKFMTVGDMRALEKAESYENMGIKRTDIGKMVDDIKDYITNDEEMDRKLKVRMSEVIKTLEEYRESIVEKDNYYTHTITNMLVRSIVAINGVTDRQFIANYVMKMNLRDANALRYYINDNAPGVDFNIEIERPESLGGGSVKMFLSIDQFIFLNRPDSVRG